MKIDQLKPGSVYNYRSNTENVDVKYIGYGFNPTIGWGYSFRAYNEDTGRYDGYPNTLNSITVECSISPKKD